MSVGLVTFVKSNLLFARTVTSASGAKKEGEIKLEGGETGSCVRGRMELRLQFQNAERVESL